MVQHPRGDCGRGKRAEHMRTPQELEQLVPIADRSAQRFPRLREAQMEVVKRFAAAAVRDFAPGESVYNVGDRAVPSWFLVSGTIQLFGRDGLNQQIDIQRLESGHFTGELHQLTGRPTL